MEKIVFLWISKRGVTIYRYKSKIYVSTYILQRNNNCEVDNIVFMQCLRDEIDIRQLASTHSFEEVSLSFLLLYLFFLFKREGVYIESRWQARGLTGRQQRVHLHLQRPPLPYTLFMQPLNDILFYACQTKRVQS